MQTEEILKEVKYEVQFGDKFLIPAIVQDADKHDVLMMAWVDKGRNGFLEPQPQRILAQGRYQRQRNDRDRLGSGLRQRCASFSRPHERSTSRLPYRLPHLFF